MAAGRDFRRWISRESGGTVARDGGRVAGYAYPMMRTRMVGVVIAAAALSLVACGGVMYAVGSFTSISQGGVTHPVHNVISFSATAPFTLTGWAPDVNGVVNSIAFAPAGAGVVGQTRAGLR